VFWILETNAPLFIEAKSDRNAIILTRVARYFEIQAYRKCDALVCISDNLKNIIVDEANIPPHKVIVVPNGVDVSRFNPSEIQPIRLFKDFTIGFLGNLASWQGINLLFDVYQEIREEGFNINLVFVGDGPIKPKLEAKVKQQNLTEYVEFTGFIPQNMVPRYIAGFDIGYTGQTQRTETRMYCSPIKLYEYMAMGIPAIASDYEDTRRVIKKGSGYLFEIGDSQDLKRAILTAYQDKEKLPKMGEIAREEILQNHSWEARVKKIILELEESIIINKDNEN
jgi:glycosyltransferase involved in cell wall biosynthesis